MDLLHQICTLTLSFFQCKKILKKLLFTFGIYFLGMFSLFKAYAIYQNDILYIAHPDVFSLSDTGFSLLGLWQRLFSFSALPQDISPLPQLLGLVCLTLTSFITVKVVMGRISYFSLCLSTLIGLTPYFLPILSSKFLMFPACFAMLCAVVPFVFGGELLLFLGAVFLSTIISFTSFPAAGALFLLLYVYCQFKDFLKEGDAPDLFKHIGLTLGAFLGGLFFALSINAFLLKALPVLGNITLLKEAVSLVYTHWAFTPLGIFWGLTLVCFGTKILLLSLNAQNNYPPFYNGLGAIGILILLGIIPFFPLIFQPSELSALTSFGMATTLMVLTLNQGGDKTRTIPDLIAFGLFWGCFIFTVHYGNLLIAQKHYDIFRLESALTDLAKYPDTNIRFRGPKIYNPVIVEKAKEYPILTDLIYMDPNSGFLESYVMAFMIPYIRPCTQTHHLNAEVLLETPGYTLTRLNPKCMEITLHPSPARDPHKRY